MNLSSELLHRLEDQSLPRTKRAQLLCQLARELEEKGEYLEAHSVLTSLWRSLEETPPAEDDDELAAAELCLRSGAISGRISGSQERAQAHARDLIARSRTIFDSLAETERAAEASIELAICFWRAGATTDARREIARALSSLEGEETGELRGRALLYSALIESAEGRPFQALGLLKEAEPLFDQLPNWGARGEFHLHLGTVLSSLNQAAHHGDYLAEALSEMGEASACFSRAGAKRSLAECEHLAGSLFAQSGNEQAAKEHLERALHLFSELKEARGIARVETTRARLALELNQLAEAADFSERAQQRLETTLDLESQAEALIVEGLVLARQERRPESRQSFELALTLAQASGEQLIIADAALTMMEELGDHLSQKETESLYLRADQALKGLTHRQHLKRLRRAARRVLRRDAPGLTASPTPSPSPPPPAPLFVYQDRQTSELLGAARRISDGPDPILLSGEVGVGKKLLARLIHEWSRHRGEFKVLNCRDLDEQTLIQELTSFPGGTLYLDGLDNLSPRASARLVDILDQPDYLPSASREEERLASKVVAGITTPEPPAISWSRLPSDLREHFARFQLEVPPLRARPDDIPPLAEHFLSVECSRKERDVRFTAAALGLLRLLPLPGNATELRHLITETVAAAPARLTIRARAVEILAARSTPGASFTNPWALLSLKREKAEYENRLIALALADAGGMVSRAARLLGTNHQTLQSIVEKRESRLKNLRRPVQHRKLKKGKPSTMETGS